MNMRTNKIISIIAVFISIVGTYIMWYDSQNTINALAELLKETTSKVGYWQDYPVDQTKISEFNDSLKAASKLDIKGFCLLMFGFFLQIITYFNLSKYKYWLKQSFKMLFIIVKPKAKRAGNSKKS